MPGGQSSNTRSLPDAGVATSAGSGHGKGGARAPRAAYVWSIIVLVAGLTLTSWVNRQQSTIARQQWLTSQRAIVERSYAAVHTQLTAAGLLLRSVQNLFFASDTVTEQEFAETWRNLDPRGPFPSLQALSFARRTHGPDGDHERIVWAQPAGDNQSIVGLDILGEQATARALLQARVSNRVTLSSAFDLVQPPQRHGARTGVTMVLPIYRGHRAPPTAAARSAAAIGAVTVSFHVADLIHHALPGAALRALRVRVIDVTQPQARLLFDSRPGVAGSLHTHVFMRTLDFGGRTWALRMQPLTAAPALVGWRSAWPAGGLISLLLALLVLSMLLTRRRAVLLARQMTTRLRDSEERFRVLNEIMPALVLLVDVADRRIVYANRTARARLGQDIAGRSLIALFDDATAFTQFWRDASMRAPHCVSVLIQDDRDAHFWADVVVTKVELGAQDLRLLVLSDVTDQRRLNSQLSYQANHDVLTDLYNRRVFEQRLEQTLAGMDADTPAAVVLYIDLDEFKVVNDTSGHLAGDQLLVQLAQALGNQLVGSQLLARLGGDEFGVLAPGVGDAHAARVLADRVRQCIASFVFTWKDRTYGVGASIGAVLLDRPNMNITEVLTQADAACYVAKEQGGDGVYLHSGASDAVSHHVLDMEWANRLRNALAGHGLVLVYQELRALQQPWHAGDCVELLLRYQDDDGQLLTPGVFMPAAERYGLMPAIDRWVVTTALTHFNELHPSGRGLGLVALNLSGASVEDDAFASFIIDLIHRTGVAPEQLCFEITETVAVRNLEAVAGFINRLRAEGCRIALDDFGAGLSSFSYLKNLPVDIIKIDGSFVRDMLDCPISRATVQAVTEVGRNLNLEVVAEWVQDDQAIAALTALGVTWAQGFFVHCPEPVAFAQVAGAGHGQATDTLPGSR